MHLAEIGQATETAKDARKQAGVLANVVRFAFATGWRMTSEVLPLEWRHVDWKGRCVRLDAHTTKNDEGRSFPFTADLEKILTEQLGIHEQLKAAGPICPFVFHRNGERIGYFRSAWWNACKAAGCPGTLVHDMRRSAVRTFERAAVPRSVAMSIVGHKTESIYRRYAIVDEAMQREAAARLDAWMAAPPAAPSTATVTALRRSSRLRDRVTG
jgi:integrase